MNFDGKALRVVVLGDGSAFGATSRTQTAGARDVIIENLSEASSSSPFAGTCQICLTDYLG